MDFASFLVCGLPFVAFVFWNQNVERYTETLQDNLLSFVNENHSDGYVFL